MAQIRYSPAMALPGNRRHMANVLAGLGAGKTAPNTQRAPLTPAQLAMLQYAKTQQQKTVTAPQADTGLWDQGGGGTDQPPTDQPPVVQPPTDQPPVVPPLLPAELSKPTSNLRWYALGAIAVLAAILLLRK